MKGIVKQTYSEQITEFIKQCMLRGEFAPGDKINEVDLASRLSVSRAPIREALQHLTLTGLLVSVPQKGKFIASLSAREIHDSYFTGGVLEGVAAAAAAASFTEADFAAMQGIVRAMGDCEGSPDAAQRISSLDTAFHDRIFAHSDNELLEALSRRSCQGISKFLLYRAWQQAFTPTEMRDRHQTVLDALKTRDPARIEATMREHYLECGRRMSRHGSDRNGAGK